MTFWRPRHHPRSDRSYLLDCFSKSVVWLICRNNQACRQPLKDQFQAQLDCAVTTRPEHRVGSTNVWCNTATAESRTCRRITGARAAARPAIWIGEDRMGQNIEELSPDLGGEPLLKPPIFGNRKIPVAEARVAEDVTTHRTVASVRR